jgi:hypothetical protein
MTLFADFLSDDHRRTHKWYQYFPVYERHFERFRNRHLTLFEIGVGEGGSVQQWRRYLGPFAIIVGIDINPTCKQVEEDQIHVRIGGQDDPEFLARVIAEFGNPDIVIDDGSHQQSHINTTFDFLYPRMAKNGVYLVEDLHAAYWTDHGGGLGYEGSFIERSKRCVDEMHAEYSRGALARSTLGDRTTSIHFYDSIVVLEVGEYRVKAHRLTGRADLWRGHWVPPVETQEAQILNNAGSPAQQPDAEPARTQLPQPGAKAAAAKAPRIWSRAKKRLRKIGRWIKR